MRTKQPNTAQVRQELNNAFDDSSLNAFCQDYFPKVYDRFSQGMPKDDKITYLLDHCRRQPSGFEELLERGREAYKISDNPREELLPLIDALEAYINHKEPPSSITPPPTPLTNKRLQPWMIALTITSVLLLTVFIFWPLKKSVSLSETNGIKLLPVTIAIAPFTDCEGNISTELQDELKEEGWFHLEELKPDPSKQEEARDAGEDEKADLVIWGDCENGTLTTHFELLPPLRGAPQVYEPDLMTLRDKKPNSSVMKNLAVALTLYLRRDYEKAASKFGTLMAVNRLDYEIQAQLYVLQGNSLLFIGEYNASQDLLEGEECKLPNNINCSEDYRILHNLAVAKMNIEWETAELEEATKLFSQIIELELNFALARVNRAKINLWHGIRANDPKNSPPYYEQAIKDCQEAQANTSSNETSGTMAIICLIEVQSLPYYEEDEELELPRLGDLESEELITAYWSTPLFIEAFSYFKLSHCKDDSTREHAKSLFQEYLNVSENDVLLEPDRSNRAEIPNILEKLSDEALSSCVF